MIKKSFFSIRQPFISMFLHIQCQSWQVVQNILQTFLTSCLDSREHSGTFSQLGTKFSDYLRQLKRTESKYSMLVC